MDKINNGELNLEANITPELVKFFYLSFKFSQGMPVLQKDIFAWACRQNVFRPIPKEIPESLFLKLKPPKSHVELSSNKEFKDEWQTMASYLSGSNVDVSFDLMERIADNMIGREIGYIKYGKRKNRQDTTVIVADSENDPYASFTRKYGIGGQKTGSDIFDKMFRDITPILSKNVDLKKRFEDLKKAWEEKHLGLVF